MVFAFGYLPFFIWAPLVDIGPDSYGYYYYALLMQRGSLPLPTLKGVDLPLGLPVLLLVAKQLSPSVMAAVLAQLLLYVGANLFLLRKIQKHLPQYGLWAALALGLFAIDSVSLHLSTMLYTECMYMSALLVLTGLLLDAIVRPSVGTYFTIGVAVLVPALIRSNGITCYILPVFLAWFAWVKLGDKRLSKAVFSGVLVGLLAWSTINYSLKGVFMFGDYHRIQKVLKRTGEEAKQNYAEDLKVIEGYDSTETFLHRHTRMMGYYLMNFSASRPSFYYSYLTTRYVDEVREKQQNQPDLLVINYYKMDSLEPALRSYAQSGLLNNYEKLERIGDVFNPNNLKSNVWGYCTHIVYKFTSVVIKNKLVVGLWLLALVITGRGVVFGKGGSTLQQFVFLIALLHFVSIALVAVAHSRPQDRYAHVSEFLLLLSALLFTLSLLPSIFSAKKLSDASK